MEEVVFEMRREGRLGLQQVVLWGLAGGQGVPRGGNRKYRGLEVGKDRSWSRTVWSGLVRCGQGHRRAWRGAQYETHVDTGVHLGGLGGLHPVVLGGKATSPGAGVATKPRLCRQLSTSVGLGLEQAFAFSHWRNHDRVDEAPWAACVSIIFWHKTTQL